MAFMNPEKNPRIMTDPRMRGRVQRFLNGEMTPRQRDPVPGQDRALGSAQANAAAQGAQNTNAEFRRVNNNYQMAGARTADAGQQYQSMLRNRNHEQRGVNAPSTTTPVGGVSRPRMTWNPGRGNQ